MNLSHTLSLCSMAHRHFVSVILGAEDHQQKKVSESTALQIDNRIKVFQDWYFSLLYPPHSRAFLLKEMEDAAAKVQLKPVKRRQRRLEFVSSARLKRQNKNCHSSFIVSIFFLYSAWRKLTGHNKYHFVTSALKETKPPLYCSSKSEFKTLRALIIYLALRDRNVMIDRDWTGKCHFLWACRSIFVCL